MHPVCLNGKTLLLSSYLVVESIGYLDGWEFGPILLDELYRIRDYRTHYIRVGTFFTPIVAFSAGLFHLYQHAG